MQKIIPGTPDITDKKIEEISKIFPNIITEKEDDNGNTVRAVDFDLLRQALSKKIVEDDNERYRLDWPGKKRSLLKANTPITKTLRPVREDSINFDTTENLYIEGDNFEALKILQESYLGKVKMIYIDPPYNTGKDFVYRDNFTKSKAEYEEELDITDEEGGKLVKNTDTNGRFHSDWLSMMYERLLISRDLLKDDGVIFISIDENEVHNLKQICNEVFGEENFISQLVWENKEGGGSSDSKFFRIKHEYILCYARNSEKAEIKGEEKKEDSSYNYSDKHIQERGKYKLIKLNSFSIQYSKSLDYEITLPDGKSITPSEDGKRGCWRWSQKKLVWGIKNDFIDFKENTDGKMWVYTKQYFKVDNENNAISRNVPYRGVISKFSSTQATKQMEKLFGYKIFDYSKPYDLIQHLLLISTNHNDLILDFFSGSATSAHAVMQLNAEDDGNRKFIMVQIPEETDESSEAYKAGYKTITEIGKERIRRAAKKIEEDYKEELTKRETPLDSGFRVFKVDSTNLEDVTRHPSEVKQVQLLDLVENIKPDRTPEDLLVEVMLNSGLELSLPIVRKEINYKTVFFVAENSLVACFDKEIDESLVDEIAKLKPLKVVLRDASFKDDKDRINLENRFKSLSPDTVVSVI
jgi:adenine-specific DNA-methyltransferase